MPNPYFKFKQFTVFHDLCAMKVGIDGVLLGAWCDAAHADSILDIGTGSGLIALMLAQRNQHAIIDAIDIDKGSMEQAKINFENSLWNNRLNLFHQSLQEFACNSTQKYDLIVSNPPFFIDSLKALDNSRSIARHTDTLTHSDLIEKSKTLLSEIGRLCVILPVKEGEKCIDHSLTLGLHCSKLTYVSPKVDLPPKRLLIDFIHHPCDCEITYLAIETENRHEYTPEFTALAKDFYLKL